VLTVLREELLGHLSQLPSVFDLYTNNDSAFVTQALNWLSSAEATLLKFRNPNAALLATERGHILTAKDGYCDPAIVVKEKSLRKAIRATTSVCLARAESALREQVNSINQQLAPERLKMAQLLSVVSAINPIPLPPTEPYTNWLQSVWNNLLVNGDTKPMHAYLSATLAPVDRLYLLDELLTNMLGSN
jgi:hypothetical protein